MYTVKDLKDMSVAELQKELRETRKTYFEIKLGVRLGKEKNTAELRKHKVYVARILTIINSKKDEPITEVKAEKKIEKKEVKKEEKAEKKASKKASKKTKTDNK